MRTVVPPSGVILADHGARVTAQVAADRPEKIEHSNPRISDHGAKIASGKIGCSVEEYRTHEAAGEHWCGACGLWLPSRAFYVDHRAKRGTDSVCRTHRALRNHGRQHRRPHRGVSYAGPAFARRVHLTPEGANAVTAGASLAASDAGELTRQDGTPPASASSGHSSHVWCPAVLGCRDGQIPAGWVRSSEVRP